jgi:uncharacterized protein YfaS (alpha-2-macroglobulin family)
MRPWMMLLALSCAKPAPPPSPVTPPPTTPAVVVAPVEEGFVFRLRETSDAPQGGADTTPIAPATPLPKGIIDVLLGRLAPMEAAEQVDFKVRPGSPPPPRAGEPVSVPFPPPEAAPAPEVVTGPLAVLRHQPDGEVPIAPQVSITFNHPMVPLTTQDAAAAMVPVTLEPQPEGQWRWVGTKTLLFEPPVRMPMSTPYTLTVPAGTRSADGASLEQGFTARFSTPTLRIQGQHPTGDSVTTSPVIALSFDQRVDPEAILAALQVKANGAAQALRLAGPADLDGNPNAAQLVRGALAGTAVAVVPTAPLPFSANVQVNLPAGAPSAEGPLRTKADQGWSFTTHGPLRLTDHRCGWDPKRCGPTSGWTLDFSNALVAADPEALVTIDPPMPGANIWASYRQISIQGYAQPRTLYTVTVSPSVTDEFGQQLGEARSVTFQVGDPDPLPPMISSSGPNPQIVDPFSNPRARFLLGGLSKVRLRVARVEPKDFQEFSENYWYNPDEPRLPGKLVLDEVRALPGDPNILAPLDLDLTPWLGGDRGHLVIEVATPPGTGRYERQGQRLWVSATQIGVSTLADQDTLYVWATDLKTGAPLEGALVQGPGLEEPVATDKAGLAVLSPPPGGPITVERAGDQALLTSSGNMYAGDSWGPGRTGETAAWFVFDDRHLYRPSETVSIKGWVRTIDLDREGDLRPPGDIPGNVRWSAQDAMGVELGQGTVALDGWGGFNLAIPLPGTPNLGSAWVSFELQDGSTWTHSFDIQEFRRPEFEVTAQVESMGPHVVGGEAVISANAHYFAGGALPGAETTWLVSATPGTWHPPGWDTWHFGRWEPPWWRWGWGEPDQSWDQSLTGRTDPTGTHRLAVAFDGVSPPRPMNVHAEASVQDVNRQAWTASADLLVHPADRYVGLKTDRSWYDPKTPIVVELAAVDLDGEVAEGVSIDLTLVRRDWKAHRGSWSEAEATVGSCQVRSEAKPSTCRFTAEEGGQHVLRARLTDAAGRANVTETFVWVSGGSMDEVDSVQLEEILLIPDKEQYAIGETAHVQAQAPFAPGYAMISFQRSGVLHHEERWIETPSFTIDVPIEEQHIPDLTVHVEVVGTKPLDMSRDPRAMVAVRPATASGDATLKVPPLSRTLAVEVTPQRKALAPGETTAVDVTVLDAEGRPVTGAQVALAIVDESVLSLGGGTIGDPVLVFHPERGSGTYAVQSRPWIVVGELPMEAPPAGGSLGGIADGAVMKSAMRSREFEEGALPPAPMAMEAPMELAERDESSVSAPTPIAVRKDFSATALWLPAATTDSRGRVHADLKLPDNLTRYRITAVAVDRGKSFGKGEADLTARLPLMLRPSAPRFLNFGDNIELPLVLQNQTDSLMTVDLALRAVNARVEGGDRAGRRVVVPPNNRVEVRIPVAADMAGTARFQAAAATGPYADAAELSLPVYTPATSEAFATYGVLDGPAGTVALRQPVSVPGEVWPQFGGLEIGTSSTALSALTDAVIYLVDYPYGCVEQISSRIISVAALRDVLQAFEAEGLPDDAALTAMVQADIEELQRRQHDDGAWGWWNRDPRYASPFTTLAATHALVRAKAAGYQVPDGMLDRALHRTKNIEGMLRGEWSPQLRYALRAHAVQVRQLADRKTSAEAVALFKQAGTANLSLDALGWLLPALADAKATDAVAEIRALLANRVSETAATAQFTLSYGESEDALILASSRRTDAILLDALLQVDPAEDLLPKLVTGLLGARSKGHWGSTQEDGWVLLALNRYFRVSEAVTPDLIARAWLGADYAGDHSYKGRTTEQATIEVPMSWLADKGPQDLIVAREGAGRLYYRLGLRYAPKDLDLAPAERGFSVTRRYEGVDDADDVRQDADGAWHIRAGARVRVTLTMEAPARRYHVALVDPLPAGLEPLNPALRMTGDVPTDPPGEEQASRGWWWGPWYEHENMRDERVEAFSQTVWGGVYTYRYVARATTPGRYVVPPAKAEEMYHPETFGRTGTARVIVE